MQSDRADRPPDGAYRIGGVGIIVVVIIPPYRRGQIQRFQNRRRELGKEPDVVISELSQTLNRVPKGGSSVQLPYCTIESSNARCPGKRHDVTAC